MSKGGDLMKKNQIIIIVIIAI
ncbi:MAG: hypothetical protein UV46_C0072G0001, partial [Candidatus Gottesmanbacteria bacterium GW2011_GWC2_42_8]